ncbi:MAG: hypothetical protein Q9213_007903 [Squamulea squamosa]
MAEGSSLAALLSSEQEPNEASYRRVSDSIISNPRSLTDLIDGDDEPFLLICLTDHGHRFTHLFARLFSEINRRRRSFPLHRVASTASTLLMRISSTLRDTNVDLLVSVVSPALETCLTSGVREGRALSATIAQSDYVVERLINNAICARAISSWTYSPVIYQQDVVTLAAWTDKLANLVQLCPAVHSLRETLMRWEDCKRLIKFLQTDQTCDAEQRNAIKRGFDNPPLSISADSSNFLMRFNLAPPESPRKLLEVIEGLQTAETIALLQVLAGSFPCNLCRDTVRRGTKIADDTTAANSIIIPTPRFGMEVFGWNCGSWEVLLSTPALSNVLSMRQSRTSVAIEENLCMLANGRKHLAGLAGSKMVRQTLKVPLSLNYCGLDRFIVWQVDVDIGYETKVPSQIVRVWDIVKACEIDVLVEHVSVIQSHWTAEKVGRCCHGPTKVNTPILPRIFETDVHGSTDDFRKQIELDVRSKDQYFFRLISKFFPLTETFFHSQELEHGSPDYPYKLSKLEMDIVCYSDTSSIIFGRSGTGKTTCLMYRLIGRSIASRRFNDGNTFKQILLTKSCELADKIRHDIRRSLATILPGSSEDAKVVEADVRGDARPTFLDPPNSLYPYVCTFEEFLQRLENTIAIVDTAGLRNARSNRPVQNEYGINDDQPRFGNKPEYCVDFPKFGEHYWPKLNRNNDRRLPLSLVFAEIMGVVKGSVVSARSLRFLTYNEYLDRSSRIAPVFDSNADRSAIYKMFQAYENHKRERQEVDYVDRVLDVFGSLQRTSGLKRVLSLAIEEIYVDEVQDQRSIDLELLLNLINDCRYFHAAGDTAQAISQESTFRFEDLKAMIYDHHTGSPSMGKKALEGPKMFQLGLNYRSHDGIVRFGSLIMDLLWKTFPKTVDKLQPEKGLLCGPSPIMFLGCEPDILTKVTLDGSKEAPADKAKFGAEQVVLVRDEVSKSRLKASIGDIALILTILQSKGMEFDDVILYDFFSSCPEPDGWRSLPVVFDAEAGDYDSKRYAAMCTELKQLYVAVTRARTKLFVIETVGLDSLMPVVRLLTQCTTEPIVRLVRREDASFPDQLQLLRADKSTNPKRWIERGWDLMADDHHYEALHCFEQANYQPGMKFADAKIQRLEGSVCLARNDAVGASKAFEASIALFLEVHRLEDAVGLCYKMGDIERAARLWLDQGEYRKAAKSFTEAKRYLQAGECYGLAQMYNETAEVLWKGKKFDELVQCLVDHRGSLSPSVLRTYVSLCKIPLKNDQLSPVHRKEIISLLGSSKEREKLLSRYEIFDALEELFIEERRLKDLFDLKLRLGQLDSALELFLLNNRAESPVGTRDQVEQLIDFTFVSRLADDARYRKKIFDQPLHDLKQLNTHGYQKTFEQWSAAIDCLNRDDQDLPSKLGQIENGLIKLVFALKILDPELISKSASFEVLLSRAVQQAITIIKDILIADIARVSREILIVCGVWEIRNSKRSYVIQAWSPLAKELPPTAPEELVSSAKAWVTLRFGQSIQALNVKSKDLWGQASPLRCARFLNGRCTGNHTRLRKHELVTPKMCSTTTKHLLSLNSIFCGLTTLYNREVMNEVFQISFLPMRRYWQERLVRELTWLSAFEQDEMTINKVLVRIRSEQALSSVASGLEALLFFRLKREWADRNGYSSLVEQMQLATALAVAHLNLMLSTSGPGESERFQEITNEVEEILGLDTVKQFHLRSLGNTNFTCSQLLQSFKKYQGKNPLVVIRRGPASIFQLDNSNSIQRMTINQVLALKMCDIPPARLSSQHTAVSDCLSGGSFSPDDILKIKAIQRWWRIRLSMQRSLAKLFKDWQIIRLNSLMAVCPAGAARFALRFFFMKRGFKALTELTNTQSRYIHIHTSIMSAFEATTELSAYELLDEALTTSEDVRKLVEDAASTVSEKELRVMVENCNFTEMRNRFNNIEMVIEQAKQGFEETESFLQKASKIVTQL